MEVDEAAVEAGGQSGPARTETAPAPEAGPGRWRGWPEEARVVSESGWTFGLKIHELHEKLSQPVISQRFKYFKSQ